MLAVKEPLTPDLTKRCASCETWKPRTDFHANRAKRDGLCPECIACRKQQRWAGFARRRESRLRERFGIGIEDYDRQLAAQAHCCAICKTPAADFARALAVDHDHATGALRGLLCGECNIALGKFRDSEENLLAALAYLRGYKTGAAETKKF